MAANTVQTPATLVNKTVGALWTTLDFKFPSQPDTETISLRVDNAQGKLFIEGEQYTLSVQTV